MRIRSTVGLKIAAGFGLGLVALIVVGLIAYQSTEDLITITDRRGEARQRQVDLATLQILITTAETGERGFLLSGAEADLNPYRAAIEAIPGTMARIRQSGGGVPGWTDKLVQLEPMINEKMLIMSTLIDIRRDEGVEAAIQRLANSRDRETMDNIRLILNDMIAQENTRVNEYVSQAHAAARNTTWEIVISTLVATLLLTLAAFLITRSISTALREITRAAERIAAGDLSVQIKPDKRTDEVGMLRRAFSRMITSLQHTAGVADEIAKGNLQVRVAPQSESDMLGNAFASMVEKLRVIMNDLRDASTMLAASTGEILATTNQIAASAAQTASAVAQTTATVEQVKQTAHLSSDKAREVSDSALRSSEVSQIGSHAVEEATHGMERIREQMNLVADSIVRLSEQRQAIGEIISSVNDLAEQSNLLAVNAAIEAAKAGEHGRGFAVVAQEVRRLAEQSKSATAQVRAILSDIEKATTAAVMATEQGAKAVESGAQQSLSAGEAIRELADNITDSTRAATQIAVSSQQQLVGMDQIAEAMESINQASLQNVASTRQASASAQNLNNLGQKLKLVIAQYQV